MKEIETRISLNYKQENNLHVKYELITRLVVERWQTVEITNRQTWSVSVILADSLVTASPTLPKRRITPAALSAEVPEALGKSVSIVRKSLTSGSILRVEWATIRFIYLNRDNTIAKVIRGCQGLPCGPEISDLERIHPLC